MAEEPKKKKNDDSQVEWSFDFANIGNSVRNMLNSMAGEEEVQESTFTVAKEGVEAARIKIGFSVGKAFLSATDPASPALLEAEVKHVGQIEFVDEGDQTKEIRLAQKNPTQQGGGNAIRQGLRAMGSNDELEWRVRLAPNIPLSLDINGGVGPVEADLTGLTVRNLEIDSGVGATTLTLPEQAGKLEVELDSGVGQTKVYVPAQADLELEIDAGVGAVEVIVAPGTAMHIRAKGGIGAVNVPNSMRRLDEKEFMEMGGVWKSEGYDLAERRVSIRYDGGVGQFTVREADVV